ncbi:MAG: hypothetical protein ACOYOJ_04540 [Alsobacter sp.]
MNESVETASRPTSQAEIRARLQAQVEPERPSLLGRLMRRAAVPVRSPTTPCCVVGVLMMLDRNLALDGLITEFAEQEAVFRQASRFIFNRSAAEVSLRFGEHDRRGRIMATTPEGYRIRFAQAYSTVEVAMLLGELNRTAVT